MKPQPPPVTPTVRGARARERIVLGAIDLIRARGVTGTGMRDVVEHAEAPRGSLQHYFPDGKNQLVTEALGRAAELAGARVRKLAERPDVATPGALFAAMARDWRTTLTSGHFVPGCPLVAATADVAAANDSLREAVRQGFEGWQQPVAGALRRMGVPRRRAASLSVLMIGALEGAIVLSRARHDVVAIDITVEELRPLLDAAVRSS